jgi:hypothetical protein
MSKEASRAGICEFFVIAMQIDSIPDCIPNTKLPRQGCEIEIVYGWTGTLLFFPYVFSPYANI